MWLFRRKQIKSSEAEITILRKGYITTMHIDSLAGRQPPEAMVLILYDKRLLSSMRKDFNCLSLLSV